jgi:hypothetical protein
MKACVLAKKSVFIPKRELIGLSKRGLLAVRKTQNKNSDQTKSISAQTQFT